LKGAIFDLDGTVVDVPYDWGKIKAELGTRGKPILTHINNLGEPERSEKWKILERFESEATQKAKLKPGMRQFLNFLTMNGVKKALVTNNSRENVLFLLGKFKLEFDCIISRERGLWKPSGAPIVVAVKELQLDKEECCVVGDSHFDVRAAEEAGISLIFILSVDRKSFEKMNAEVFSSVEALQTKMLKLLEMKNG
jgi:HAD superfamily hydrolase (TIGR01509 family)